MTDRTELTLTLRTLLLCVTPYRDPLTRRRVRQTARDIVAPAPWAGEKADNNESAQLALLRLLWLQREAHRAAHRGMFESVALLTRSAIDTCIVGLYCLTASDAAEQLNKLNAHNLDAMTRYLPATLFDPDMRGELIGLIDTPERKPNTFDMVTAIDAAAGNDDATMLYRAYYAPLSTLYAHGGGLSLLRHTKGSHIRDKPSKSWLRSAPLHLTDACLGLLAGRLATTHGQDTSVFDSYYETHRSRTMTPLFTIGLANVASGINWSTVPRSVSAMYRLTTYVASGRAANDDEPTRQRTVRSLIEATLRALLGDVDANLLRVSVDGLTRQILDDSPSN